MSGHRHNPTAGTQNQGNSLGDRSCVRQSKLYRMYESGNGVKDALGSGHLAWDTNYKQGAYAGQKVFDHMDDNGRSREDNYGSRGSNNNYSHSQRNNDENNYPTKNTLSHYARGDDYSSGGGARGMPSYDNDYAPKNAVGGRGNSSGGGPSSFLIGQSSYSQNDDYNSRNGNFNRRTSHEPIASGDDCYPMNKMGSGRAPASNDDSYRGRPPMPDSDQYSSNKGRGGGYRREEDNEDDYPTNKIGQQGSYRSLKDQMNHNSNNSNFQPTRTKSSEVAADRVARSYFPPQQQERSTRPW